MEITTIKIDNQPVAPTFFGEGKWLTDYVTPEQPDVVMLYNDLTKGLDSDVDKIVACWDWVANQVRYKPFIAGTINIEGHISKQADYWQSPSMCIRTQVGNCANKTFLLVSLLRNALPPEQVHCVLGNLYNGHQIGHAWPEVTLGGRDYIVESTRGDVAMIEAGPADRYEPVHYFNERNVYAVPGRTLMTPFQACYSSWLKDYIDWNYVNNSGR